MTDEPFVQLARLHPQPQDPERAANIALGRGARVRFDEKTGRAE